MKKLRLILVVCGLLLTIISSGQARLTFRLANPAVAYMFSADYFGFDIQVKADAAGSYLFSGQAILTFNNAALVNSTASMFDWIPEKGALLVGTYMPGQDKYNGCVVNLTGGTLNIAWTANANTVGQAANSTFFNEVTTSYQTVVRVYGRITNPAGVAGIDFIEGSMNGMQSYKLGAAPWSALYTNPNLYEAAEFMTTYLGRIYANAGWTQYGVSGGAVDWTTDQSTSVWDGNPTLTGGSELHATALRIHAGATLTVPSSGKLTVHGATEINTAKGLVINSDVSGTGSFISGTVTGAGTADVQRYVTGGGSAPNLPWHLISAPVTGQTVGSFIDLAGNNIALNGTTARYGLAYYDNAAVTPAWVYFTAANKGAYGPFVNGKGYSVLSTAPTGYVTFTGNVATANVSPAITFDTNKWWNLVGNPYPSAVNANALANASNFLTANDAILGSAYKFLYVWDPTVQNYSPVGNFEAYRIPVGQAFFIRTVSGATTASFASTMRTHEASAFKGGENTLPSINLKSVIADKNYYSKVYFISGTTAGIDEGYDAGMFEDNNPAIALSTHIQGSDIDFAIQSLPDTDYENTVVSVGLNGPEGANVVFTADVANLPGGTKVYLEDRLLNTFTRLDDGGSYSIELKVASKGTGRFFVHTKQGSMGIDATVLSSVKVYGLPQEYLIRIDGDVEPATQATVYDMNGKVLVSVILRNPNKNEIPFMPLSSGIYMLKLQSGTTIKAEKINWVY